MNTKTTREITLNEKMLGMIDFFTARTAKKNRLDYHQTEDLKQDMCVAAMKFLGKYDPERGMSAESYLYMKLDGWCTDFGTKTLKAKKNNLLVFTLDEPANEGGEASGEEAGAMTKLDLVVDEGESALKLRDLKRDIAYVLSRLDEDDRKVLNLIYVDGMSLREVARTLGMAWSSFQCMFPKIQARFIKLYRS